MDSSSVNLAAVSPAPWRRVSGGEWRIIMAVALALLGYKAALSFEFSGPWFEQDESNYALRGYHLANGDGLSWRHPARGAGQEGYPALLALPWLAAGQNTDLFIRLALILNCLLSFGITMVGYLVLRHWFRHWPALLGAVGMTLYAPTFVYGFTLLSEELSYLVFLLLLLVAQKLGDRPRWYWWALLGAVTAAAISVHVTGLTYAVALGLTVLYEIVRKSRLNWWVWLGTAALALWAAWAAFLVGRAEPQTVQAQAIGVLLAGLALAAVAVWKITRNGSWRPILAAGLSLLALVAVMAPLRQLSSPQVEVTPKFGDQRAGTVVLPEPPSSHQYQFFSEEMASLVSQTLHSPSAHQRRMQIVNSISWAAAYTLLSGLIVLPVLLVDFMIRRRREGGAMAAAPSTGGRPSGGRGAGRGGGGGAQHRAVLSRGERVRGFLSRLGEDLSTLNLGIVFLASCILVRIFGIGLRLGLSDSTNMNSMYGRYFDVLVLAAIGYGLAHIYSGGLPGLLNWGSADRTHRPPTRWKLYLGLVALAIAAVASLPTFELLFSGSLGIYYAAQLGSQVARGLGYQPGEGAQLIGLALVAMIVLLAVLPRRWPQAAAAILLALVAVNTAWCWPEVIRFKNNFESFRELGRQSAPILARHFAENPKLAGVVVIDSLPGPDPADKRPAVTMMENGLGNMFAVCNLELYNPRLKFREIPGTIDVFSGTPLLSMKPPAERPFPLLLKVGKFHLYACRNRVPSPPATAPARPPGT